MPITITNNNSVVGISQEVNTVRVGMASAFDVSSTALQAASDAEDSALLAVVAAESAALYAPAYYEDMTALLADDTVWPVGTVVNTRKEGSCLTAGASSDTEFDFDTAPTGWHVQNAASVPFYINRNAGLVRLEDWGMDFTGNTSLVESNTATLKRALDFAGVVAQDVGGAEVVFPGGGHAVINRPPMLWSNVTLDGRGGTIENIRTRAEYDLWGSTTALAIGGLQRNAMGAFTWHKLAAVTIGNQGVTLQSTGDASAYQVGDVVLIAEGRSGMAATPPNTNVPLFSQFAIITQVSADVIYLERHVAASIDAGAGTIGVDMSGAWVANFSQRNRSDRPNPDATGFQYGDTWCCVRPKLYDIHLVTQFGEGIFPHSATYEMDAENVRVDCGLGANGRSFGPINMNGLAYGSLRNFQGPYFERALEIKCMSHNTEIVGAKAYKRNADQVAGVYPQSTPISIGERSRDCIIRDSQIDVGEHLAGVPGASGFNLIAINDAKRCIIDSLVATGGASYNASVYINGNATQCEVRNSHFYTPANLGVDICGVQCSVVNNKFFGSLSSYPIRVSSTADSGEVSQNMFSTEGKIRVEVGGLGTELPVSIYDNTGVSYIEFASAAAIGHANVQRNRDSVSTRLGASQIPVTQYDLSVTSTSEAALGAARIALADSLSIGDTIALAVAGTCSGTAGVKYLRWRNALDMDLDADSLDADDDTNISPTITIPAAATAWHLDARCDIKVAGASGQIVQTMRCIDFSTGAVLGSVTRVVSCDLTKPMRFELSAWVAASGDAITARSIRYGVLPRPGWVM